MNIALVTGVLTTTLGALGYVFGIAVAYPGRAFSLTLLMLGLALALVSRAETADPV